MLVSRPDEAQKPLVKLFGDIVRHDRLLRIFRLQMVMSSGLFLEG
jgi:hypothetical protein